MSSDLSTIFDLCSCHRPRMRNPPRKCWMFFPWLTIEGDHLPNDAMPCAAVFLSLSPVLDVSMLCICMAPLAISSWANVCHWTPPATPLRDVPLDPAHDATTRRASRPRPQRHYETLAAAGALAHVWTMAFEQVIATIALIPGALLTFQ